jgi:pantoate--beta-alanine ligase
VTLARLAGPADAQAWSAAERAAGRSVGLVATMGALHEGHLTLVRRAVEENDRACASVFVNPLQFDEARDFESYPRDLEADAALLESAGCHAVFSGTLEGFFPEASSRDDIALSDPGPAAVGLEGAQRNGHFEGVATIVTRLFELVAPTRAYFGEKDFQQTLVVKHVAATLGDRGPEIVVCPTSRDPDGLARSSRNLLLAPEARGHALALARALYAARAAWRAGERDASALTALLWSELDVDGVEIEYAELRDPEHWGAEPPTGELRRARALVAARASGVRLIDNLALDGEEPA